MSLHITFDVKMYPCGGCTTCGIYPCGEYIHTGKCTTRGMYPCGGCTICGMYPHGRQIAAPTYHKH